jgi:hypothetical protein
MLSAAVNGAPPVVVVTFDIVDVVEVDAEGKEVEAVLERGRVTDAASGEVVAVVNAEIDEIDASAAVAVDAVEKEVVVGGGVGSCCPFTHRPGSVSFTATTSSDHLSDEKFACPFILEG